MRVLKMDSKFANLELIMTKKQMTTMMMMMMTMTMMMLMMMLALVSQQVRFGFEERVPDC